VAANGIRGVCLPALCAGRRNALLLVDTRRLLMMTWGHHIAPGNIPSLRRLVVMPCGLLFKWMLCWMRVRKGQPVAQGFVFFAIGYFLSSVTTHDLL